MMELWCDYFYALPKDFQILFKKSCKLQKSLMNYLENNDEDNSVNDQLQFSNLTSFIIDNNINTDIHNLSSFILLLSNLSKKIFLPCHNYFHRIQKVLLFFKKEICLNIPNEKLIKYFNKSNQMLLFLYQNEMIDLFHPKIIDNFFSRDRIENIEFFYPEIKKKIIEGNSQENFYSNIKKLLNLPFLSYLSKIDDNFIEYRNNGFNDDFLAEVIRNDSIDGFIEYKEKSDMNLNSSLPESLFEGNLILSRSHSSLIEYAAFYGSIQIFKYLYKNKVKISSKTWVCAICGQNYEIIHILEEDQNSEINNICFKESISLHCNDIATYFFENHLDYNINDELFNNCLNSFNFQFLKQLLNKDENLNEQKTIENENLPKFNKLLSNLLEIFCRNGHYYFVDALSKVDKIDMNMKFNIFFYYLFFLLFFFFFF